MKGQELQQFMRLLSQEQRSKLQEAITNERARVAAIHALAKPGTEEQIKYGIENGLNAGEVAINILNAQTALNNAQLENMTQDAEESGVNQVGITATPQNTNEQEKQLALSNMANIMNGGRAQLENMTQDAEESGVNQVGITATPQNTNEQEKQLALSNMANIMNGGRK